MPQGVTCVPGPKKYYYQKYFTNPTDVPPYPPDTNEALEIAADTKFMLKSLSGMVYGGVTTGSALTSWGAIYLQIQLPSGRMLQNLLTGAEPYTGFGSSKMIWNDPVPCPAGSKIFVTIDDSISGFSGSLGNFTIMLCFSGALYYYLKEDASSPPKMVAPADSAKTQSRYFFSSPNQNILAPEWMVSELDGEQCHPETPAGFADESFTYSQFTDTNGNTPITFSEAHPQATTIRLQVSSDADFLTGRIMFQTIAGDIAPMFFGRVRTSLGSVLSLCDDYIPLNNIRLHTDWKLKAGMQVYIDVYAITAGGTSTTTLNVYLEGAKRRRAA